MRYYIADLHFYHHNMNKHMDCHGFESAACCHAEYMISQWNKRVRKNDEVVIIGDLSLGKAEATSKILKLLNGRKFLICGNHDLKFLKDPAFDQSMFKWVKPYAEVSDNKRKVVLSHYPIFCYNPVFDSFKIFDTLQSQ